MLLGDEAGFYRQPSLASSWGATGRSQPRAALSCRSNRCLRAAAAFDPVGGRLAHRLRRSFPAVEMGRFYELLSRSWPEARRLLLVLDNWPTHSHPRAWRGIETDPRIEVLWLPTYAPWLNPTEKLWKWVRQRLTHLHPYADAWRTLRAALERTLQAAADSPEEILRYTGTGRYKLYSS